MIVYNGKVKGIFNFIVKMNGKINHLQNELIIVLSKLY